MAEAVEKAVVVVVVVLPGNVSKVSESCAQKVCGLLGELRVPCMVAEVRMNRTGQGWLNIEMEF